MMGDRGERRDGLGWAGFLCMAMWLAPAVALGQQAPDDEIEPAEGWDAGGDDEPAPEAEREADPEPAEGEGSEPTEEAGEPTEEAGAPTEVEGSEPTEEELERARALFGEGVDLADEGQWDAAAEKFREALAIKNAAAVRFNLASALYESGDVMQAHIELQRVLENDETAADIRGPAEDLAERMDREAGRLTPEIEGSREGVTLRIDDRELPRDSTNGPVVVSAGEHTVTAHRDGREVARQTASVEAGEAATVTLSVAPSAAETAAVAPAEPSPEPTDSSSDGSLLTDWRLWAGVGAAVVVIVGVAVVAAVAGGKTEDPVQGDFEPGVLTWK